jgi:uncharacterized membrane protein (DUF4010 family)
VNSTPWLGFAVALGIGLLIGLERERSKGEGAARRPAGIRTFTLAALLGAVAVHIGAIPLLAAATVGVTVLAALSHFRAREEDPGLTAAVAVIFAAKAPLHGFARNILTSSEVADGLVFTTATLVIWPQLPNRYMGPFQALNPHSIWFLVILVLALGACGHVATRALGARFGLPIAGLASGFVSSTATVAAMASRAAIDPASMRATVAAAAFSTVATFVQMALLLATVSQATLILLAPALAAGGLVATLYGAGFALHAPTPETAAAGGHGRAFSVWTALGLAATMAVMLVVAAALRNWLGDAGVAVGAVVAGFLDTHSAAISVASLAASGTMTPHEAIMPILAAMTSNTVAKLGMAIVAGSRGFALRIAPGLAGPMAAAWAVAAWAPFQ